jgi:hypothetical protein
MTQLSDIELSISIILPIMCFCGIIVWLDNWIPPGWIHPADNTSITNKSTLINYNPLFLDEQRILKAFNDAVKADNASTIVDRTFRTDTTE